MNNGLQMTYSDVRDQSYCLANNFVSIGLKKGDRIAFLLPNTHELVICYFASALAGLILVPFDLQDGVSYIRYMFEKIEPTAVVVYNSVEYQTLIEDLLPEINKHTLSDFKSEKFVNLRHVISIDEVKNPVKSKFHSAWSYENLVSKLIENGERKELPYVDSHDIFAISLTVI